MLQHAQEFDRNSIGFSILPPEQPDLLLTECTPYALHYSDPSVWYARMHAPDFKCICREASFESSLMHRWTFGCPTSERDGFLYLLSLYCGPIYFRGIFKADIELPTLGRTEIFQLRGKKMYAHNKKYVSCIFAYRSQPDTSEANSSN